MKSKLLISLILISILGILGVKVLKKENLGKLSADNITLEYCGQSKSLTVQELSELKTQLFAQINGDEPLDPCYLDIYLGFLNSGQPTTVPVSNFQDVLKEVQKTK